MVDQGAERLRRLRWQCRRGTQELDHLLAVFLRAESAALKSGQYRHFERLLASEDDRLWDWLLQREQPEDEALCDLIAAIRSANGL